MAQEETGILKFAESAPWMKWGAPIGDSKKFARENSDGATAGAVPALDKFIKQFYENNKTKNNSDKIQRIYKTTEILATDNRNLNKITSGLVKTVGEIGKTTYAISKELRRNTDITVDLNRSLTDVSNDVENKFNDIDETLRSIKAEIGSIKLRDKSTKSGNDGDDSGSGFPDLSDLFGDKKGKAKPQAKPTKKPSIGSKVGKAARAAGRVALPLAVAGAAADLYDMHAETQDIFGDAYKRGDLNTIKNKAIREGLTSVTATDAELKELADNPDIAKDILDAEKSDEDWEKKQAEKRIAHYGRENIEKIARGEKLTVEQMRAAGPKESTAVEKADERVKEAAGDNIEKLRKSRGQDAEPTQELVEQVTNESIEELKAEAIEKSVEKKTEQKTSPVKKPEVTAGTSAPLPIDMTRPLRPAPSPTEAPDTAVEAARVPKNIDYANTGLADAEKRNKQIDKAPPIKKFGVDATVVRQAQAVTPAQAQAVTPAQVPAQVTPAQAQAQAVTPAQADVVQQPSIIPKEIPELAAQVKAASVELSKNIASPAQAQALPQIETKQAATIAQAEPIHIAPVLTPAQATSQTQTTGSTEAVQPKAEATAKSGAGINLGNIIPQLMSMSASSMALMVGTIIGSRWTTSLVRELQDVLAERSMRARSRKRIEAVEAEAMRASVGGGGAGAPPSAGGMGGGGDAALKSIEKLSGDINQLSGKIGGGPGGGGPPGAPPGGGDTGGGDTSGGAVNTGGATYNPGPGSADVQANKEHIKTAINKYAPESSNEERAAMAAVIAGESAFKLQNEISYAGTPNDRIRSIFGRGRVPADDATLNKLKADPSQFFEHVYGMNDPVGKTLGNNQPGDGVKYLGRGFIGITGKANYAKYAKVTGIDILNKPELANDPKIAAEVAVKYMMTTRKGGNNVYESIARGVGNPVASTEAVKASAFESFKKSGEFSKEKTKDAGAGATAEQGEGSAGSAGGGGGGNAAAPAASQSQAGGGGSQAGGGGAAGGGGGPDATAVASAGTTAPGPAVGGAAAGAAGGGSAAPQSSDEAAQSGATTDKINAAIPRQEKAADVTSLSFAPGVDSNINNGIAQKISNIENSFGQKLTINSGFRDPHRNASAGGAKNSAHMRANAVDVSFAGDAQQTLKLVETASKAGIGGIGVYKPGSVHLDTESKRVWGPDFTPNSIAPWAKGALDAHMTGQWGQYDPSAAGKGPTGGGTRGQSAGGEGGGARGQSAGGEGGMAMGGRQSGGMGGGIQIPGMPGGIQIPQIPGLPGGINIGGILGAIGLGGLGSIGGIGGMGGGNQGPGRGSVSGSNQSGGGGIFGMLGGLAGLLGPGIGGAVGLPSGINVGGILGTVGGIAGSLFGGGNSRGGGESFAPQNITNNYRSPAPSMQGGETAGGGEGIMGMLGVLAQSINNMQSSQSQQNINMSTAMNNVGTMISNQGARAPNPAFPTDRYQNNNVPAGMPSSNLLRELFDLNVSEGHNPAGYMFGR